VTPAAVRAAVPVAAPPLSLRLKEGTREAHDQVERAAAFNRLVVVRIPGDGAVIDRARHAQAVAEYREVYRRFLLAAHGFEAAVNRALESSPARAAAEAAGYAPEDADPAGLIRADLLEGFGAGAVRAAGVMDGLPAAGTLAEFAGIEYVRRGSRAGGAVIAAVVQHNLGFTRERGASFLARYGRQTKSLLVAMREWLDRLPLDEAGMALAVRAAAATFAATEAWHLRLEGEYDRA
jgi:heme oxygenase